MDDIKNDLEFVSKYPYQYSFFFMRSCYTIFTLKWREDQNSMFKGDISCANLNVLYTNNNDADQAA